ncbi:MAG: PIG-L family deacetylase, partial [Calditrichaeota bacterium]
KYAHEGHRVGLVTMTRGEAGSLGISKEMSPEQLAAKRSEELHCAARILNLKYLNIHQLPDKKLSEIPEQQIQDIIRKEIEQFSPDALITFHDGGISGHPDHQTVTRIVLKAVNEIKRPTLLFWFGLSPEQAEQITSRKLIPLNQYEITHKIDVSGFLSQKKKAIQCHKSQVELWRMLENTPAGYDGFASLEYFVQIRPFPANKEISAELF